MNVLVRPLEILISLNSVFTTIQNLTFIHSQLGIKIYLYRLESRSKLSKENVIREERARLARLCD